MDSWLTTAAWLSTVAGLGGSRRSPRVTGSDMSSSCESDLRVAVSGVDIVCWDLVPGVLGVSTLSNLRRFFCCELAGLVLWVRGRFMAFAEGVPPPGLASPSFL